MVKKIIIFLLVFLMCRSSFAAFTLDTSAESAASAANPLTLAYTCGANAKLLVLAIGTGTNTSRTGGSPTYNGVTMLRVGTEILGAVEVTSELWYLSGPVTGSSLNISVPNSGTKTIRLAASSFNNTGTGVIGAGLESFTTTNTTAANPSLSITPATDGTVIVDSLADGNTTVPSANSQTLIFKNDNGSWSNNSQYALVGTRAATTFSWTVNSDDVAFVVGVFKESVGALIQGDSLIKDTSVINGQ